MLISLLLFILLLHLSAFAKKNHHKKPKVDNSKIISKTVAKWIGNISIAELESFQLLNFYEYEKLCREYNDTKNSTDNNSSSSRPYDIFTPCTGKLTNLSVFLSNELSDVKNPIKICNSIYWNKKKDLNPFLASLHAPHLVSIPNAFVNIYGQIFDRKTIFIHGGCSESTFGVPNVPNYNLERMNIVEFDQPVISIVQPHGLYFYHEWTEVHACLLMCLPLIKAIPNIKIILQTALQFEQLSPLLNILDIYPQQLNLIPFPNNKIILGQTFNNNTLIQAKYIITPLLNWCTYVPRNNVVSMRSGYAKLDNWNQPNKPNWIVINDRRLMNGSRFLPSGNQIIDALKKKYGKKYPIHIHYGNESLNQTLLLFRNCKYFIAAHGAAESFMLFMNPKSVVVEVRPLNYDVNCFDYLADVLQLKHYVYFSGNGGSKGIIPLDLKLFLPLLYRAIDDNK